MKTEKNKFEKIQFLVMYKQISNKKKKKKKEIAIEDYYYINSIHVHKKYLQL